MAREIYGLVDDETEHMTSADPEPELADEMPPEDDEGERRD